MPNTTSLTEKDLPPEQDLLIFWDYDHKAHMIHVQRDEDAADPRKEMDHFTKMACFHPRHQLGDEDRMGTVGAFWEDLAMKNVPQPEILEAFRSGRISIPCEPGDEPANDNEILEAVSDWILEGEQDSIKTAMELLKDRIACLPMWLYDHSGLSVACGERAYPYNDRFDSSPIGWIVALKSDVMKELQCPEADWESRAEGLMSSEVDTYDRWLRGDTWAVCHRTAEGAVGCNENGMKAGRNGRPGSPMSGESDWDDGEWTCGFYGDGILDSGIAESVGCGLGDAIMSGNYWTGKAESHTVTVWDYVRDGG